MVGGRTMIVLERNERNKKKDTPDTTSIGGSLQYSGVMSAMASSHGSINSVSEVLGAMMNIIEAPTVIKSAQNPDGGHTYTITFPISMKNVPQMAVHMSDVPISISTLEDGNVIQGSFRIEFEGETTANIDFDADSSQLKNALEMLPSIGTIHVNRGQMDDQNGCSWTVEFTSDVNAGDISGMVLHGDWLTTTNPIGGANIQLNVGGTDGSFIGGSFSINYGEKLGYIYYYQCILKWLFRLLTKFLCNGRRSFRSHHWPRTDNIPVLANIFP